VNWIILHALPLAGILSVFVVVGSIVEWRRDIVLRWHALRRHRLASAVTLDSEIDPLAAKIIEAKIRECRCCSDGPDVDALLEGLGER
jgi:hypothetical protein